MIAPARRRFAVALTTVLAASAAIAACAPAAPVLTEAHAAAIRDSVASALEDFQRYSAASQWDSLGALYSDAAGFRFAESGAIRYHSAQEIRDALHGLPGGTTIRTSYDHPEIDPLGPGMAVLQTPFETTFVDAAGGSFGFHGVITMVWVHEAAGWRIRSGHPSAPVPRPS